MKVQNRAGFLNYAPKSCQHGAGESAFKSTHILQIYWIYKEAINLDGRYFLDEPFLKNEIQIVLYKLVLVTDPLDHSSRIYSLSNLIRIIQKPKKSNMFRFIEEPPCLGVDRVWTSMTPDRITLAWPLFASSLDSRSPCATVALAVTEFWTLERLCHIPILLQRRMPAPPWVFSQKKYIIIYIYTLYII